MDWYQRDNVDSLSLSQHFSRQTRDGNKMYPFRIELLFKKGFLDLSLNALTKWILFLVSPPPVQANVNFSHHSGDDQQSKIRIGGTCIHAV
jgi:hypothetical protein